MEKKLTLMIFLLFLFLFSYTGILLLMRKDKKKAETYQKIRKKILIFSYFLLFLGSLLLIFERYQYPCDYFSKSDYEILVLLRLVLSVLQVLTTFLFLSYLWVHIIERKNIAKTPKKTIRYLLCAVLSFLILGVFNAFVGAYYVEKCEDHQTYQEGCYYCKVK